jgi:hypothetical protein
MEYSIGEKIFGLIKHYKRPFKCVIASKYWFKRAFSPRFKLREDTGRVFNHIQKKKELMLFPFDNGYLWKLQNDSCRFEKNIKPKKSSNAVWKLHPRAEGLTLQRAFPAKDRAEYEINLRSATKEEFDSLYRIRAFY